jgi:ubiquinone biosynthesis monooxygenase Coq7
MDERRQGGMRGKSTGSPGDRMVKVDHAGEHGAICIYSAQIFLARLTAPNMLTELMEFRSHEKRHRDLFKAELSRRGCRRCRSYWLCGLGGYVLGLTTGLCGPKAIAATTAAVERVVLRHLKQQIEELRESDPAATAVISSIVEEERLHHDLSTRHIETAGLWSRIISPVVAAATETVIWLGMRL